MGNSSVTRTIEVDAVDRLDNPITGVAFVLISSSGDGPVVLKAGPKPVLMDVTAASETITIEARPPFWPPKRVTLAAGTQRHTFRFAGGGEPRVLVVCALNIEMEAMLGTFDWHTPSVVAGTAGDPVQYWIGHYGDVADAAEGVRQVRLTSSGMGNNNSAIMATHALRSFYSHLDHVLMVGIAGGCPNRLRVEDHVRLGDIVVATKGVVQYDYQKRLENTVEIRSVPLRTSRQLIDAANTLEIQSSDGSRQPPWTAWIDRKSNQDARFKRPQTDVLHDGVLVVDHPDDPGRRPNMPRVHGGVIGSANILLKDPKLRDEVRDKFGVRAIEMEGSGMMDAGWVMDKNIMVVRGICDYCDVFKDDSWQPYAALVAAAYTRSLIEALPEAWFP